MFDKVKSLEYAKKVVKENFIYPKGQLELIAKNLLLFLYGNDNNAFSRGIK